MKKFVGRIFLFGMGLAVIIVGTILLSGCGRKLEHFFGVLTSSEEYSRYVGNAGTVEIIPYIEKVQEQNTYSKLIIGDSVCFQMYDGLQEYNDEYCIAGTNRAITIAGQYLLVQQFIENHDYVTDIYLIVTPGAFDAYYDTRFGYQYAIMPFAATGILDHLEEETLEEAEKMYGSIFLRADTVNLIDYSAMNRKVYLNLVKKYADVSEDAGEHVSGLAINYLAKIQALCEEHDIEFHLLPGPIADTQERKEQLARQINDFKQNGLYELVEMYYSMVQTYPEEQFYDGTHFGGIYGQQESMNEKIKAFSEQYCTLEGLHLSE